MKKYFFYLIVAAVGLMSVFVACDKAADKAPTQTANAGEPPPEREELTAARNIEDSSERLKELQRIKAAYPNSTMSFNIDSALLDAAGQNADTFDKLLAAQKEIIKSTKQENRFLLTAAAADMLFGHAKSSEFPAPGLLKAVQNYRADGIKLLANPTKNLPESRRNQVDILKDIFEVSLARAQYLNGDGATGLKTILAHGESGRNAIFWVVLGEIYLDQKREEESLDAYFQAAAEGNAMGIDGAKAVYVKINGSDAGFDAELEKYRETRPFNPAPFNGPANWKGKVALIEIFTGSECPPCVAAGFGFDGIKESYSTQYVAVLKYHLPIPRYDPMMNPATKVRQDYYGVSSTPTAIVDGTKPVMAGGYRTASLDVFNRAKSVIDPLLGMEVQIDVKASATLNGNRVQVDCDFSKVIDGADYHVVLVQTEQEFKGYNGIKNHKMVVRDIQTVAPASSATVTFNIPEAEKAADAHITEWGKTAPERRITGSQWPLKRNIIDRKQLKAVVFVQDKESKLVHNAFVADVVAK